MKQLLTKLRKDFPELTFAIGETFSWSSRQKTVFYPTQPTTAKNTAWSLLHELGHALLGHNTYHTDFELLQLEAAAWAKAAELGATYGYTIDPDHIQDCLDTYRDWLHQRSTCPTCGVVCLQGNSDLYCCYNCNTQWRVSRSRLCRPYRRLHTETAGL